MNPTTSGVAIHVRPGYEIPLEERYALIRKILDPEAIAHLNKKHARKKLKKMSRYSFFWGKRCEYGI